MPTGKSRCNAGEADRWTPHSLRRVSPPGGRPGQGDGAAARVRRRGLAGRPGTCRFAASLLALRGRHH